MQVSHSIDVRRLITYLKAVFLILSLFSLPFAQTQRWVYRVVGSPGNLSAAQSVMYGNDGNIYAAGHSWEIGYRHLKVVSLTSDGVERWVYLCPDTSATGSSYSITEDNAGNIYVCGHIKGIGTDFVVISLDPDGDQRWIYQYNGAGNGDDAAQAVAYGPDGNVYAAGYTKASYGTDFTVVSLDTAGSTRWVHNFDAGYEDEANSIAFGTDSTIYVAGQHNHDMVVTSFEPDSTVNWICRKYSSAGWDWLNHVILGLDGNIYAAGTYYSSVTGMNMFAIWSVTPSGNERWLRTANWDATGTNIAFSVTYGPDDNVYASGFLYEYGTDENLAVVSGTSTGTFRFTYRHPSGASTVEDCGYSILYGPGGNVYVAGRHEWNFIVLCLTPLGNYNWEYVYDLYTDVAFSMVCGADSHLYVSGATGAPPSYTVLSLDVSTGVSEICAQKVSDNSIRIPFCFDKVLKIRVDELTDSCLEIMIFSSLGALVYSETMAPMSGYIEIRDPTVARLPAGIYFVVCSNGPNIFTQKTIKFN